MNVSDLHDWTTPEDEFGAVEGTCTSGGALLRAGDGTNVYEE